VHRLLPDIIKAGEEAPRRAAGLVQQLPPANLSTLQVGACSFVVVLVALCGRLDGQPGAGRCACQSVRAGIARCVQTGLYGFLSCCWASLAWMMQCRRCLLMHVQAWTYKRARTEKSPN